MLLAQHSDAPNATSTTSGDANPAYDTTMTSPPTTAPAGATLLAPNPITRAEPTTSWASPTGLEIATAHAMALLVRGTCPPGRHACGLPSPMKSTWARILSGQLGEPGNGP